ncbi:MAG: AMP-dependent synthetase/ligase [Ktedonobacteraceae bacterium]|jgi:long-chain acyl-CoA synthetase
MPTINSLFAGSVEHHAQSPALIEPTEGSGMSTLTYRELQERAQGFAGYLQKQQLEKGNCILIWSASRSNWLVAYLGALLAGVIVVPLDISSKEDFLNRVAEITDAKLLITTHKQYTGLKNPSLPLLDIDTLPQETLDSSRLPEVNSDDLAEVVFTSGTTGQPKGVMLSHGNIASNATAAVKVVNIQAVDRALSILPLSHMFELTIEVALLHSGASIVYARSLVPEKLLRLFEEQHATCMVLVPQALQLFLNGIEREVRRQKKEKQFEQLLSIAVRLPFNWRRLLFGSVHKRFGGRFRFFVSGGAYLPPKLAARWENMGFRVMQGYGATECSPVISVTPYKEHLLDSVGKPLPDVDVRIAADEEIVVHGPNVARGYWKNPEATAAVFKDGWYYTGDLGYLDAKGNLYLKGRKKNLIVLANGLNVYPEDIENVLQTHPLVKEAVVVGLMEEGQEPEVHAVLLMDDPSQARAVIQQVNKQLASHQQIRGFTVWPETDFPRTYTMKVKRPEVLNRLQEIRKQAKT